MMFLWKKIMSFLGHNKTFQAVLAWSKRPRPIATPSVPSGVVMKPIDYVMNDPSTPQLIKQVMPPTYSGKPALNVK
jgi:hypothetical protein